jgi:large subunit ribosomal protein L19
MNRIANWTQDDLRKDVPTFSPGDTVSVSVRVIEGDKERLQAFQGICIGRKSSGLNETFTVRKISMGIGVERVFPLHGPSVAKIDVVRRGHVRRAKLTYLRGRKGKSARVRDKAQSLSTPKEEAVA